MQGKPRAYYEVHWAWSVDSANDNPTASVVTLTGVAGQYQAVAEIFAGYTAAPAATKILTVSDGTTTVSFPIVTSECKHIVFDKPFVGAAGATVTITLPASGAGGVTGYLNCCHA